MPWLQNILSHTLHENQKIWNGFVSIEEFLQVYELLYIHNDHRSKLLCYVCFQACLLSGFIYTLITGEIYFAMDIFDMLFQIGLCSYFLYTMIIEVSVFDMDRFNMLYQVWLSSCFIYTMITGVCDFAMGWFNVYF